MTVTKCHQLSAPINNCQEMLDSLFGGEIQCHAPISPPGSVGVTAENSKPREYNPELARQLLAEAGYDPTNEININSRPGSSIRGPEILEAVITYWRDVGVNSNLNSWSDLAKAREIQLSGCGVYSEEPGYEEALDCAERGPAGPYFSSSHVYEIATSDEILDFQRQGNLRMGCFSRSSRVCFPDLQKNRDGLGYSSRTGADQADDRDWGHCLLLQFPFCCGLMVGCSGEVREMEARECSCRSEFQVAEESEALVQQVVTQLRPHFRRQAAHQHAADYLRGLIADV
ncbi:MAG TPA: ABC transporter substrate-binding protein, partial [Dehalococcoidia bacterium]|nr:ABC transporter substrate-binding protein [Dehalococcoidia bacterium]